MGAFLSCYSRALVFSVVVGTSRKHRESHSFVIVSHVVVGLFCQNSVLVLLLLLDESLTEGARLHRPMLLRSHISGRFVGLWALKVANYSCTIGRYELFLRWNCSLFLLVIVGLNIREIALIARLHDNRIGLITFVQEGPFLLRCVSLFAHELGRLIFIFHGFNSHFSAKFARFCTKLGLILSNYLDCWILSQKLCIKGLVLSHLISVDVLRVNWVDHLPSALLNQLHRQKVDRIFFVNVVCILRRVLLIYYYSSALFREESFFRGASCLEIR